MNGTATAPATDMRDEIIERLTRMEANQDNHRDQLHRLDERLFGNGQPGVLADMVKTTASVERRVAILERYRYWLGGLIFGLPAIYEIAIHYLLLK